MSSLGEESESTSEVIRISKGGLLVAGLTFLV